jgi:hypothetical protein
MLLFNYSSSLTDIMIKGESLMKIIEAHHIFDNPLPQLKSRQSYFPFACECKDSTLIAFTYLRQQPHLEQAGNHGTGILRLRHWR